MSETATKPSKKEEEASFAEEQAALAATQNKTAEGAVPEQRPQAASSPDPNAQHSSLRKRLEEEGALPDNEPMGKEAYDRAASEDQMKAAAKASRTPRLLNGTRVVVGGDGPHRGRPGVIVDTRFASDEEAARARSGEPSVSNFAEVESYTIRTRDSRTDLLDLEPDEIEVKGVREGWSRGE
jgi:hypothetical protein